MAITLKNLVVCCVTVTAIANMASAVCVMEGYTVEPLFRPGYIRTTTAPGINPTTCTSVCESLKKEWNCKFAYLRVKEDETSMCTLYRITPALHELKKQLPGDEFKSKHIIFMDKECSEKDKELKAAEIELREAEAGFKAVEKAIDEAMAQIPINNKRLEKAEAHLRKLKAEQ